jgi:hypothetical protein
MKRNFLILLLSFLAAYSFAQDRKITGTLIDHDTKEPMMQVTVQLLKTDSTFVAGGLSDEKGQFSITAPDNGKYLLKFSSVGYTSSVKRLEMVENHDLAMGRIVMSSDAVMLKGATVTGQAVKVILKEDTFIYNSAAYRTPEGSVVEELVKRLPGATVSDDGTVTINGKTVKKVLVDGKEFMTGDTKTAMKNLPTSIVEKVKAYDEKSDLSRVTGIDDGNETTVLDFGLKRGMNKGLMGVADLGVGTKSRYAERLFGGYMTGDYRLMAMANANNVNDRGFPGGGGRGSFGGGRNGLMATKMLGTNFNYEKKDLLKIDGSVRWNHSDGDTRTKNSSENFYTGNDSIHSYSNSLNQSYSRGDSWNFQGRLEWTPDTMTNIMFRPTFSFSKSDGRSISNSASYSDDPYQYVTDPLDAASIMKMAADSLMVNARQSNSISYSDSKNVGGMFQYNRKLNSKGRNVTARADVSYSDSQSKSLSTNNVHLYQVKNVAGADSTYQTNRYMVTPTKRWNYSLQATYSEPLWKATFLQFSYKFNYSYSKSDNSTYDFSNLGEDFFGDLTPQYRNWTGYLSRLANPYTDYLDKDQSRFSQYKTYTHDIELMFRMIRTNYNFNLGVLVEPQTTHFVQRYMGVSADTTRTVTNITPTLDFRYRFSKVSNLRLNYRATTSQPEMSQLIDITNTSDPLNITKGNPGLKPSFTNNFSAFYNNYIQNHMRFIMANMQFATTRNSISNMVTYNQTTGGRISQPQNINGNWNVNGDFMFNTSIDTAGVWNITTHTNLRYTNNVGFVTLSRTSDAVKNVTKDMQTSEQLNASYRNDWLEVSLDGSFTYQHATNKLQSSSNLNTWTFSYGPSVNLTLPWGMSLATDIHENSRRGYNDNSMNTNELVWNAQLSQGFLTGKPLTVSVQFYDILHQQSNFSRVLDAMQRSDTEYNSINSYAMLHVIYRMNLFGNKQARQQMRRNGRPDMDDGPGGRGGGPDGDGPGRGERPRGNFGGHNGGGGGFGGPSMVD